MWHFMLLNLKKVYEENNLEIILFSSAAEILVNTRQYLVIPGNTWVYFYNNYIYQTILTNTKQYLPIQNNTYQYKTILTNTKQYLPTPNNTYQYQTIFTNSILYLTNLVSVGIIWYRSYIKYHHQYDTVIIMVLSG